MSELRKNILLIITKLDPTIMKGLVTILVFALFIANSCKSRRISSLAVVGKHYSDVKCIFTEGDSISSNPDLKLYEKNDTLIVLSFININPFEAIFLFENDTCVYQKLKIYCSPCADEVVEDIVNDRNYKFEVVDPVNYISKNNDKVVMRLKEKLDEVGNCNEISIIKIKENK